jgi:hypothetical protein
VYCDAFKFVSITISATSKKLQILAPSQTEEKSDSARCWDITFYIKFHCLSEIQPNLDDDFKIQGIAKPGSDLEAIMHAVNRDTGTLIKQDAVVVWSGIRDISRNESQKVLCQMRNFMEKHSQTNVLVVHVPNRFDLGAHSCVNCEVNTFNRK